LATILEIKFNLVKIQIGKLIEASGCFRRFLPLALR